MKNPWKGLHKLPTILPLGKIQAFVCIHLQLCPTYIVLFAFHWNSIRKFFLKKFQTNPCTKIFTKIPISFSNPLRLPKLTCSAPIARSVELSRAVAADWRLWASSRPNRWWMCRLAIARRDSSPVGLESQDRDCWRKYRYRSEKRQNLLKIPTKLGNFTGLETSCSVTGTVQSPSAGEGWPVLFTVTKLLEMYLTGSPLNFLRRILIFPWSFLKPGGGDHNCEGEVAGMENVLY